MNAHLRGEKFCECSVNKRLNFCLSIAVETKNVLFPSPVNCRLLTDIQIRSEKDALEAMQKLHEMGAKTVVISSSNLGSDDVLVGLGSTVNSECANPNQSSVPSRETFEFGRKVVAESERSSMVVLSKFEQFYVLGN